MISYANCIDYIAVVFYRFTVVVISVQGIGEITFNDSAYLFSGCRH